MKALKSIALSLTFSLLTATAALARVPWGTTGAPLNVAGDAQTCTYTSTALACINKMTGNVTTLTLAGMTAGTYYTMIWMQDGTGSRTLAASGGGSITGAPALTTAESAANGYAVWIIKATSASAATFVQDFANAPLTDGTFVQAVTTNTGQAVANVGQAQAAPTIVVPGMTAAGSCRVAPQAYPATWNSISLWCVPQTNAVELFFGNASAATVTATATSVNVRISE